MRKRETKKENKGFALLFSVLVSSLLLTIGLSIFNIALKELAISTASRQSIHAFYAADSGREYILYQDTKLGEIFKVNDINNILKDLPLDSGLDPYDELTNILVDNNNKTGPNFDIILEKEKNTNQCGVVTEKAICTTLNSFGHDSLGGDRVERAIQQTY
jgi:hypothetical protein